MGIMENKVETTIMDNIWFRVPKSQTPSPNSESARRQEEDSLVHVPGSNFLSCSVA